MNVEKVDVAIIGGGLAGLTLAKFLAEEGIDFILFEEHDDFYKKVCGEGIGRKLAGYRFLDLYEGQKGIEREINECVFETRYGDSVITTPLFMINKKIVEKELASQTIKKGGDIRMNEKVSEIKRDNDFILTPQNIKAKFIVGSDGVSSITREYLGIKKPHCAIGVSGLCKDIEKEADKCYIEFNKNIVKYGYAWFFPRKDLWNIGVGSFCKKYFKIAFNHFKQNYEVDKWVGGYAPMSMPLKLYGKNMFLVGDAGSQIRTTVGAGNLSAMASAKIAFEILKKFARRDYKGIDTQDYAKTWNRQIGTLLKRDYRVALIQKKIMRSDFLLHLGISGLARFSSKNKQ